MITVRCPFCRENDDKVVDSRAGEDGAAIRRRRECLACGKRFTTYERLQPAAEVRHLLRCQAVDREQESLGVVLRDLGGREAASHS